MSLTTRNKIIRRNFTQMPVTESVIKQVKEMAAKTDFRKDYPLRIGKVRNTNLIMMRNTKW
jgi:hypothetical protein